MGAKRKRAKTSEDLYLLLPLVIFMAVVPLIVYMKVVPLDENIMEFWKGGAENPDFFSYYKSVWIMISGVLALVGMGVGVYLQKVNFKQLKLYYVLLGLFGLLTLLSAVFSEYRSVSFWGFPDRHEGAFVLLAYLAVTFSTINLVNGRRQINFVLGCLFVSAFIAGAIGIFQFFGYDFFRSMSGRMLILPSEYHHLAESLSFTFGPRTIYTTMYNTNYVGSYAAMVFALSFVLFLSIRDRAGKIAMGAFNVFMFAVLLGCNSRAGYVGALFSGIVVLVLLRRPLLQQWRFVVSLFVCLMLVFAGLDYAGGGRISRGFSSLVVETFASERDEDEGLLEEGLELPDVIDDDGDGDWVEGDGGEVGGVGDGADGVEGDGEEAVGVEEEAENGIRAGRFAGFELELDDRRVGLSRDGHLLQMLMIDDQLVFRDGDDEDIVLGIVEDGKEYNLQDPRFADYRLLLGEGVIQFETEDGELFFRFGEGHFRFVDRQGDELALEGEAFREGQFGEFSIFIEQNSVTLVKGAGGEPLVVTAREGRLYFTDGEDNNLSIRPGDGDDGDAGFRIDDGRYGDYAFVMEQNVLQVKGGDTILYFLIDQDGFFRFVNEDGLELAMEPLEPGDEAGAAAGAVQETTPPITDVQIDGGVIVIETRAAELHISIQDDQLVFHDGDGEDVVLNVLEPGVRFSLEDRRFEDYRITVSGNIFQLQKGSRVFNFAIEESSFKFINHRGEHVELEPIEAWGFEGRELMGSSRGYIWSRSFPLLRDTLFLGYGPDTYAIYYPQHDYIGKILYLGSMNMIVDKPHNMYLQFGINTGVLSLLVFLVLAGYYAYSSITLYLRSEFRSYYAVVGVGIFAAVFGYLVTGIFNDSIVSVAPVFWGLLGIGISCNYMYSVVSNQLTVGQEKRGKGKGKGIQ